MNNYKNSFFLYDRCFYLLKETDKKVSYTSLPEDASNGITVEIDKESKNVGILYFKSGQVLSKLSITNDDGIYNIKYTDQEVQNIIINDNLYVNLLLELYVTLENGYKTTNELVKVTRKRNLNKIVYCEPTFPLDRKIKLSRLNIKSTVFEYFKDLIDHYGQYCKVLEDLKINKCDNVDKDKIIELDIPNEFYFYDRVYNLVNTTDHSIMYKSEIDTINNLNIIYEPCLHYLESIELSVKDKKTNTDKYKFSLKRNEYGGNDINFHNLRPISINLTNITLPNCSYKYNSKYDDKGKEIAKNFEIESLDRKYLLTNHPIFTNKFVDQYGYEYCIANQEVSSLYSLANFSKKMLSIVEKKLTKNND